EFFSHLQERAPSIASNIINLAESELKITIRDKHDIKKKARLGAIYLYQKKFHLAYETFGYVINTLPNLNRPYLYLGDLFLARKDFDKMKDYYKKSAFLDKSDFLSNLRMAQYYFSIHDFDRAHESFQDAELKHRRMRSDNATRAFRVYNVQQVIYNDVI